MSRKMLINASESEEIRVAIVEGSILEEYYVERRSMESVLGNVYKGRVTNVEPSIGAAFVDFGGNRHGFLHVSDVAEESLFSDEEAGSEPQGQEDQPDVNEGGEDADAKETPETEEESEDKATPEEVSADDDADDDKHGDEENGDSSLEEVDSPELGDGESEEDDLEAHQNPESEDGEADDTPPDAELSDGDHEGDGETEEGDESEGDQASDESKSSDESDSSGERPEARSRSRGRASASKKSQPRGRYERRRQQRNVTDLLEKGQEVVIQVTKDGIGTKGPTLTTYLSLPGRYLVLMPGLERKGVSRKIDDVKERDRLKKVLGQLDVRENLGFIVRTAGIGQGIRALQKDYHYLTKMWDEIEQNSKQDGVPATLYKESDLVIRTIRDVYNLDMGDIIIDDEDCARRAREFLAMVMPKAVDRVKLYDGERPLFNAYGIEEEIGNLFMHRVELPSGGSLIIEQTEALVAIDVNSGRFRDEDDLEETAYKINVEASEAIARQLRLRDLGGVVVVDFIDMLSDKRRRSVERTFKDHLRDDRARIKVARISPFGTIELTRQRVRPSLRHSTFKRCPCCRGAGYVATKETLVLNLFRQIKLVLARNNAGVEVFLNLDNAEHVLNQKSAQIQELQDSMKKSVHFRMEAELRGDEFRILPL